MDGIMDFSRLRSSPRPFEPRIALLLCLVGLGLAILVPRPATAQEEHADHAQQAQEINQYCGTNIPPDEALGFVPLPEGDVFCPLIADPKASYSYLSYVRGTSASPFGTDLYSVGIGDRFGLARWGGPNPGEGFQLSMEGAVFAQFDANQPSFDLINADYLVGVRSTFRRGAASGRIRVYHQSSHLGDEFILRSRVPRENFAFQSAEAIFSADSGPLRFYLGGELMFNSVPGAVETQLVHGGIELRQRTSALRLGNLAGLRLVAAADFKSVEDLDWKVATSARAGIEVNRAQTTAHAARSWSILGHWYDGPAPYGQFFREHVEYYGVGLHFSL